SLRLDHNLTNNNRLTLRAGVSPSDQTGIQVQAQGPQNFGQNSFSRTSLENYHDWNIAGQDQWTIGTNKINELRFQYARRACSTTFRVRRGAVTWRSTFRASRSLAASRSLSSTAPRSATSLPTTSPGR